MENASKPRTHVLSLSSEKLPHQPKLVDNALTRALRTCCFIPQRFLLSTLSLLGVCNAYAMRMCLNLAITQMVNKTREYAIDTEFDNTSEAVCPSDLIRVNTTIVVENPGPTMPGFMIMLAKWVPPYERSLQTAIVFGGGQFGNVFGSLISGYLLSGGRDWAYVFYFYGAFGIFWFVLWSIFCYSTPNTHPFTTEKELDYLNANVMAAENKECKDPVPWKAIVRSAPVWALIFASIGHDWGFYAMVSDLPKYSHEVLKFNIATTGSLTSLPYVAMILFSFGSGFICDLCVKKGWHTIKTGRIIYTTIAATGPAICIVLASYAGCDRNAAIAYFILSMGLMGGFYAGMKANTLDLAPNFTGSLTSLFNTISTLTGIIAPFLIGLLTPNSTISEWRVAFWVCFVVLVGTNVVYCIWAEGDQQWWDDVRQFGYPQGWKHGPLVQETNPDQPETVPLAQEYCGEEIN